MKDLLLLTHRIPYPPNKGDKLRAYHLLRYLADRYRVYLGTFVDDPDDWAFVGELKKLCADVSCLSLNERWARGLAGLIRGEALTVACYRDPRMQRWVDHVMTTRRIERICVFSSAMAQYVTRHLRSDVRGVIDFVDVDSDKWRQYAGRSAWPASWIYAREGRKLLTYERKTATLFDKSVFVSRAEAALFCDLAAEATDRVEYLRNGVDAEYFSPDRVYPNPYAPGEQVLVFTGAMDYRANVDAVCWFAREVFPGIRAQRGDVRFYIVGARPAARVRVLNRQAGITVTGRVDDVRPYIAHASACVAPLRIARGVQNKVLEALAMGKWVLATRAAVKGLDDCPEAGLLVADTPVKFMAHALGVLADNSTAEPRVPLRRWVQERHDWCRNLGRMGELLESQGTIRKETEAPLGLVAQR